MPHLSGYRPDCCKNMLQGRGSADLACVQYVPLVQNHTNLLDGPTILKQRSNSVASITSFQVRLLFDR
jgi:hypothetical protein